MALCVQRAAAAPRRTPGRGTSGQALGEVQHGKHKARVGTEHPWSASGLQLSPELRGKDLGTVTEVH